MGKARALKLGIVKGISTVATKIASNMPLKCPVCGMKFNVQSLFLDEKNGGDPALQVVNDHIKMCIGRAAPGKTIKHGCGQEISIEQLDEHLKTVHGYIMYNNEMLSPEEYEKATKQ